MSRVSDLTCDETMSAIDEVERRDGRRFFQQSVSVPIARIAPVVPSVALQQNSRQFVKTYIRSQANAPFAAGCSNGSQKMVHTYGTTSVSSIPQCSTAVPGRSKLVTIRPVGTAHSFLKSYDIAQISGGPMTTVYLQQQHNLHLAGAQQPVLSLPPSRARELEESRVVRSSPATFANCGNIDSRRYLTSGRSVVGVGDVPVRSSVRVNPIISNADFLRGAKVVTRISDERTDMKPVVIPAPTVNIACSTSASSVAALHDTCIPVPVGQHDGIAGTSYPGPSARPTILRKNRESGSLSAVRRLIVAEAHPHTNPYQEVLASPLAAVKDNSGLMCFKRANATDGRMLSGSPCMSPDARGIFSRKTPALLIGNVVQNAKNFPDQIAVAGAVEVSPRKRLRKQNFECTNTEKMKLLISTERVVGDSFVTVKDELTWKSADLDCESREMENPVPEKMPKRRSRMRVDNCSGTVSLQQRVSASVPHQINSDGYAKVKRMKKAQIITRNKLSASGVPAVVELDSNSWPINSFVDEKRPSLQYGQTECADAETIGAQVNQKWIEEAEVQKIEDTTYLMCHIFGLEMAVPGNSCSHSQRILHNSCDISATLCFFGEDKINGNNPSTVLDETLSDVAIMLAEEPFGSTAQKSAITSESTPDIQNSSGRNEVQCHQFTEQNRKVLAQMLLCSGLKDRWQRFDRISGCERVIKRIYVKRWMLQEHFRNAKQSVTTDVELNLNLIASLEDYSLMAAKKQAEKFLENYTVCSPSTSDNVFEKNVNNGPVYIYKYLEEALEIYTRSASSGLAGTGHISSRRSIQTGVRLSRGLQPFSYASRRDPETEMLQAVAEVLAEIIEIVVESDKGGQEEKNEQQHLGRKRKKKDDHLFEIKIADRFGTLELPHTHTVPQTSNSVVTLYDNISQYTLSRKRKAEARDADDAFFMNIEKELNRKRKRIGKDKSLSRTLHSISQMRVVHQRLSDLRKAERDNLNEATKQMLNLVRYSDPTSYAELINDHKEDCQPYDNEIVREEKWQNRLLSFTKAVPSKIISTSRNYDANIAMKLHPPMNYTLKLFREKCIRPPKRFRSGMKRTRKSQSRRNRGRQRGSIARSKKKSPTPESKLEDLEPHFTAAEMGAMFKKEFGMDMNTFRYERCSQQKLHSACIDQEQPFHSREEQRLGTTETSIRNVPCTDCVVLKKNTSVDIENKGATVSEVTAVISEDPEVVIENLMSGEAQRGNGSDGSHVDSLVTVPYIDLTQNDEISLSEHVQTRGRYIREHFATLLHALRMSELLTVKAIKMFKDYTADLFDNRDAS